MFGKRRLVKPMLGIDTETHVARVVPIGTIVEIPTAPLGGVRKVDVLLNARPMIMFVWDLRSRSEEVVGS